MSPSSNISKSAPDVSINFGLSSNDIDVVERLFGLFHAKLAAEENIVNHHDAGRSLNSCAQYSRHKTALESRLEAIDKTIAEYDPDLVDKAKILWQHIIDNPETLEPSKPSSPVHLHYAV